MTPQPMIPTRIFFSVMVVFLRSLALLTLTEIFELGKGGLAGGDDKYTGDGDAACDEGNHALPTEGDVDSGVDSWGKAGQNQTQLVAHGHAGVAVFLREQLWEEDTEHAIPAGVEQTLVQNAQNKDEHDIFIRDGTKVEVGGDDAADRADEQGWLASNSIAQLGSQWNSDHGHGHRHSVNDEHGGALNMGVLGGEAKRVDQEGGLHDGVEGDEKDADDIHRLLLQYLNGGSL